MTAKIRAVLYGVTALIFWSSNAVVAVVALSLISLNQVLLLQFGGASLILFGILAYNRLSRGFISISLRGGFLGVVGVTGTIIFQYISFSKSPIIQANIIAYIWPMLTIIALYFFRYKVSFWQLSLVALGGFGALQMISGEQEISFITNDTDILLGYASALASALCMSIYTVSIKSNKDSLYAVLFCGCFAGFILLLIYYSALFDGEFIFSGYAILLSLYLGACPMALGYVFWSMAIKQDHSNNIVGLAYAIPILSTVWLLIFGYEIGNFSSFGALLVLISCLLLNIKLNKTIS